MTTVSVPQEKLAKVLADVEVLIADVASLVDQDEVTAQRLRAMKTDPSVRRSEQELDEYLTARGVKIDHVDN